MQFCQLLYYQSNHQFPLLLFDVPLLHYYIDLSSSIISSLFSQDVYLSLGIYLLFSFVTVSELFSCEFFWNFVILLAILWPIKSPASHAIFWIALYEAILNVSVADCLAWSRSFLIYLPLKFLLIFLVTHIFCKRQKSIAFYKYSISRLNWIAHHFLIFYTLINN